MFKFLKGKKEETNEYEIGLLEPRDSMINVRIPKRIKDHWIKEALKRESQCSLSDTAIVTCIAFER
jgi:hypothetical protein